MTSTSNHISVAIDEETKETSFDADKLKIQEAIVSNFAGLLGIKTAESSPTPVGIPTIKGTTISSSAQEFAECLSDAITDSDKVCTLPSFDLRADFGNEGDELNNPLPNVGEHHKNLKIPQMAASVLGTAGAATSSGASELKQSATQHLGTLSSWTKSTLVFAPSAVSRSVTTSFRSLVESRLKAWTLLLLRHSLTSRDTSSRDRLLSILSSKIELKGSITSFKTLELPEAARQQPREADVILPLIFEAIVQISSQGRNSIIPLRAPGTIIGHFSDITTGASPGLKMIEVNLDVGALLESMVEQARLVVFKVVARATAVDVDTSYLPSSEAAANSTNKSVACLNSSLNLTADRASRSQKLQKAQSSALRLNSILQGQPSTPRLAAHDTEHPLSGVVKTKKNRSVQWEHPLDLPKVDVVNFQNTKRQRMVQSQTRLRSIKSFGRPHAEPGAWEPKNATFGDFGRGTGLAAPVWGRDGKLLNHPVPRSELVSSAMNNLDSAASQGSNQNATFDLTSASQTSRQSHASLTSNLGLSKTSIGGLGNAGRPSGGPPSTLPRTATALESWLVKNTTH